MTYHSHLIQAASMEELAGAMDEFFETQRIPAPAMIINNITLVPEVRTSAMSPTNQMVVFSCIITYHE